MGRFQRIRDTILVVLLIAVPFFFLRAGIRRPDELGAVDRAIMRVADPIVYACAAAARFVSSIVGDYVYLVDVKSDNNKLAYENARLRGEIRQLRGAQAESRRLRRLLSLREEMVDETVSAMVIAKDTTDYFRVTRVVLDSAAPGLKSHMPVVSVDGVVGTVEKTYADKVDVRLTVDASFGVDVVVERTGARGFIRGTGDLSRYVAHVEMMKRSDEVDVGDVLLTSGLGCRFPKGLPVARVTKISKRDFGTFQSLEAEPTVDFSRLQDVLIVLRETKDCSPRGRSGSVKR
ncbi:MAG: rod shape-determining protein MreC [Polyangiaceae bacterium]|nr:rod shape-determining protein MreC [Polyangiaceae bacterium]